MPPLQSDDDLLPIVPAPGDNDRGPGNLSAFIVENDLAYLAPEALHGRSQIEQGVRWLKDVAELPSRAKQYWIAWVSLGRNAAGQRGYRGLTISEMFIDAVGKVGYKSLPAHVNAMKAALDGKVELANLPESAKQALAAELNGRSPELWRNAFPQIKQSLNTDH